MSAELLERVRLAAGLSQEDLATRAGTSRSTLSAYESGRVVPSVETLARVVRGAGFDLAPELTIAPATDDGSDTAARGRELVEVLELAAMFPARHAKTLEYPRFGLRNRVSR